jgi:predicted HTH transcriptional regulator
MDDLIPTEDLARAHERYLHEQERVRAERQRTRPKTRAEILCEIVREDPTVTIAELAEAADRSASWVRRTLRQAGIVLARPVHQKHRGDASESLKP